MNRKPLPREENIYETKCPILYAMELIGQKWKLPILWYIADAENQTLRYRELERRVVGAIYFTHFWGILLVAYGAYLMTSTYRSSNYTVKKLITAINASGKGFPSSRYCFTDKGIEITYHPGKKDEEKLSPVGYGDLLKLGEDANYFYLFPTASGGYAIPKYQLGEQRNEFVRFVESKTGKTFYRRRPSPLQRVRDWLRERNNEPVHL